VLGVRFLVVIGTVWVIATVAFVSMRVLPGDPARLVAGQGATVQAIDATRHRLGLDRSLLAQYVDYIGHVVRLDFGTSLSGESVSGQLLSRLPATLELILFAAVIYITVSLVLGLWLAAHGERLAGGVVRIGALIGGSLAPFWLAAVLQIVFYYELHLFPAGGRLPLTTDPPPKVTGFDTVDALAAGQWHTFTLALWSLALPALALAIGLVGVLTRLVRAEARAVSDSDYVRTVRAKGVSQRRVSLHHVLPNASIPIVTVIGVQLAFLLSSAVVVETVFQWPGVGSYLLTAIQSSDANAVTGAAVILGFTFIVMSFLLDAIYRLLAPQSRVTTASGVTR
jgi:peptide/nickel transport system permease protein